MADFPDIWLSDQEDTATVAPPRQSTDGSDTREGNNHKENIRRKPPAMHSYTADDTSKVHPPYPPYQKQPDNGASPHQGKGFLPDTAIQHSCTLP